MLVLKKKITKILSRKTNIPEKEILATFRVPKEEFGELSTSMWFLVKGRFTPEELKREIERHNIKEIEKIEIKGGYINFFLSDNFYVRVIDRIVKERNHVKKKKTGKTIMVEYFHANTHKGIHIGHIRNICIGEALSRILEFSRNKVIRANYQGDVGPHVAKCLWGFINIYKEKAPKENLGRWLGEVYAESSKRIEGNEKLEREVRDINTKLYSRDKEIMRIWKKTREWCLEDFERFYEEFGVKFDELYFESQTEKIGTKLVKEFFKKGVLKEDQNAIVADLRDDGLGIFVLLTKEGYPLYSTKDLGLIKLKLDKYKLDRIVHVVGKEQELYFKQLFKTFEKVGFEKAAHISYHLIYELVTLPEGKMSSREGTVVLYEELKERLLKRATEEVKKRHGDWGEDEIHRTALQISLAAIKFSMLNRENNKVIVFDWEEALKLEGGTGPYLQYTCVRAKRIEEKAKIKPSTKGYRTTCDEEKHLIKLLSIFPEIIETCADGLKVNPLAEYALDVATTFNKFYASVPVLKSEYASQRLSVVIASRIILSNVLDLLGISIPKRM